MLRTRLIGNKKVLPRERKRHTARRIASACYAALSNGGGGVPHPVMVGGTWGTPPSRPDQGGTPSNHGTLGYLGVPPVQTWDGVPPTQTWDGVPPYTWNGVPLYPDLGWGTPHPELGWGTHPSRPGWGTPPPEVWTDKQTENSTFPHAGGKNNAAGGTEDETRYDNDESRESDNKGVMQDKISLVRRNERN